MAENGKLHPQVTGNAGLYYVCYRLSLLGWNVMPTARNARGIDVIAYNASGEHYMGVQVKALSVRNPVPLGADLERLMGDWWVVVSNVITTPVAYVLRPADVKKGAHRGEKDGRVSYWLQPPAYDRPEYREAWHQIGRGDVGQTADSDARRS
jgi:hypothetical protein